MTRAGVIRAARAALAGVLAVIALTGCGIPQPVFLEEPVLGEVGQFPPVVTFTHPVGNDVESFAGYELYYKFYVTGSAGEQAFAGDRSAVESAAPGAVTGTLDARGFHRVYTGPLLIRPALAITATEQAELFDITVTFQASPGAGADASWNVDGARTETLLRDPEPFNAGDATDGFADSDISPGQPDLPPSLDPSPGQVAMALAFFAYGTDFATGTFAPINSQAVVADRLLQLSY